MKNRDISLIAIGLLIGAIIGGVIGNLMGWMLPEGVVKDFFLTSFNIDIGSSVGNQDGVVIIFGKYKRRGKLGTSQYNKDDVIIHQILNTQKGSGKAKKVINEYFAAYQEDVDKRWGKKYPTNTFTDYGLVVGKIILSVRSANSRARRFYKKMGMSVIGNISWSKGTIGGKIYGYNVY